MTMRNFAAVLVSCAAFLTLPLLAADRVQAGEWETKMVSSISAKPIVTKYCITAAEAKAMNGSAADIRKFVQASTAEKTGGRCSVKSVTLKGNRTVVAMLCGKTEMVGTTDYAGNTYTSSTNNGVKISGKRIGACAK
jgi:hypothetical protein